MAVPVYQTIGVSPSGSNDSVVVTAPTGIADNDILVAIIYAEPQTQGITPPTGFTSVALLQEGTYSFKLEIFWKRAASESGNYTFTETGNTWGRGKIARISGCITTGDPFDVVGADSTGTDDTAEALGVTTTVAETLLLYMSVNGDELTYTVPAGMTERSDTIGTYLATEDRASAGATGGRTGTLSGANAWAAVLGALKPPAAGGIAIPILTRQYRQRWS